MEIKKPSIEIFFPHFNRPNLKYWYKLNNGHYQVKKFVSLSDCIKMAGFCKQHSIPFKASTLANPKNMARNLLLINTLLVLNRLNCNKIGIINLRAIEAI